MQPRRTISANVEGVLSAGENTDNDNNDAEDEHDNCQTTARSHFDQRLNFVLS